MSVTTTTGSVKFSWRNVIVTNNVLVNVKTTTGSVNIDLQQNGRLSRDVTLKAEATTGAIDFAIDVQDGIGAKITSGVTVGRINIARRVGFSGTESLLQSDNYPGSGNVDVSLKTTTDGINIDAEYTL